MNAGATDRTERAKGGDELLRQLRRDIHAGRLVPGQRLIEADLTARFGISRGPVREAFRQLSAEGLVELVPHRGASVRRLRRCETLELFQIRTELEALAARLAAGRMDRKEERARFAADSAPVRRDAPRHPAGYILENKGFHDAIMAASGNLQLARLNANLQLGLIMAQVSAALPPRVVETSLSEHRRIADAILDRAGDDAEREMRAHLTRARDYIAELPEEVFPA